MGSEMCIRDSVWRMPAERLAQIAVKWQPGGQRPVGRRGMTWRRTIRKRRKNDGPQHHGGDGSGGQEQSGVEANRPSVDRCNYMYTLREELRSEIRYRELEHCKL